MKSTQPLPVIARSLKLLVTGRVKFPKERCGQCYVREDGRSYRIFREIVIARPGGNSEPGGTFRVWFQAKTGGPLTRLMAWGTTLFFLGMPGFRHKVYLIDDQTGEFGGIYEWNTREEALAYLDSFAMRLSAMRSVPGQFSKEVLATG